MKRKSGKEMRKLMLAVSMFVLLLVLTIIAYFMTDVVITTNKNIEHNQDLVIEQSVFTLQELQDKANSLASNPEVISLFNEELIAGLPKGNEQDFADFTVTFNINFYPIDYVGVIIDGELLACEAASDFEIDPAEMTEVPDEDYIVLDEFGGKEGCFISQFNNIDLSLIGLGETYINMIVDRTEDMADVKSYFERQRNDLILRLSIVSVIAIILSLLLTTVGLRYFTRKYVVNPIDNLNRMAEEISEGTFDGEVTVDPDSAYAALQGLLRSGQIVLQHMDDEMKE